MKKLLHYVYEFVPDELKGNVTATDNNGNDGLGALSIPKIGLQNK